MSTKSGRHRASIRAARPTSARPSLRTRQPRTSQHDEALRLYDFAPAMFVLVDGAGLIVEINQTGCEILGKPRDRLVGLPLRMWMAEESRGEFLEHLRRCRADDAAVESEMRLRAVDGGTVLARFYSKRCGYRGRRVFATVVVDLTEYVVLDRARKTAERQRDHAERERELARAGEATKDRLIATVSHELRNPLSPALVAADVLASWSELPERARQLAAVIKRNIELEAHLIDDLLDLARASRGKLQLRLHPVDLHQLLLDAVNACAPDTAAKAITISVDFQAWKHVSRADADRLRQVFGNILNNAVKFSDPGGAIIVRTASDGESMIRIVIHDQGIGMDPDTIARLFKPFEQQDQPGGLRSGLGLGLTICDSIISGHGGRLWATSEGIGRGSTFEIELATCAVPVGAGHRSAEVPREIVAGNGRPADANARRRALIVEDHHDSGTLMSMFLSQQGYDVTLSQTLADGLEQLDREWDVVLADIGLGDGSGLEVARRGRSLARPPGRMVALSGFGSTDDLAASREAGFDEHLVKPVDLQRLLKALEGKLVAKS